MSPYDAVNFVDKYNNLHNSIKLTTDISKSVVIMDITVSINTIHIHDYQFYDIKTTLYQKPSNKYLYLSPLSFHQPSIFFNFINSELKRYCLYCSDNADYNKIKTAFYNRLISRGYTRGYLFYIFTSKISRTELLHDLATTYNSPPQPHLPPLDPLIFITTRTPRTDQLQLQKCLVAPEYVLASVEGAAIFNRIILCNKTTNNLEQLLIQSNFDTPVAKEFFTSP